MKGLFIGLVLGAIAVWFWYQTGGKIHITEIKTVTNEVVVTVTATQVVEQLAYQYITKTNEVWKTNVVEKILQTAPVAPVVQKVTEQPKIAQPITVSPTITTPITETPTGLRKARPAGKVTIGTPARQDMKVKIRRGLDGEIKK